MIFNYIKLAWRVLWRKKFFTFISLFGISFTLGILMVALSFMQSELGAIKPLSHKSDFVLVDLLRLQTVFYDTIPTIDTFLQSGVEAYDTTFEYKSRGTMMWNSSMNNQIAENYLSDLPSAEDITIFNEDAMYDVFVNGVKLTLNTLYGDPSYWKVFDHEIIEGRAFDQTDMDQAKLVTVISDKTAESYFGTVEGVINKEIYIDGKNYLVIGMYKHNGKIISFVSPDMVMPYSTLDTSNQDSFYHGYFSAVLKKHSKLSTDKLKEEVIHAATLVPMDHPSKPEGFNELVLKPRTYDEMYAQGIYYEEDGQKSYTIVKWILISLMLFFILLPTLNLINLNVSRIMERSSEIGVRKAFGAHQGNIITQFIIENIVQTILGGIIGLVLALLLIRLINQGGYLGSATLNLSPTFFMYSLLIIIFFGIISGLIPAYKMSKLQIVQALKSNKL